MDSDPLWFFRIFHATNMEYVSIQLRLCLEFTLHKKKILYLNLCDDKSHLHSVLTIGNENYKLQNLVETKLLPFKPIQHMSHPHDATWAYNLCDNPMQHWKTLENDY